MTIIDAPALALSAPVNLRDLGGIPIDGGVLRTGLAIRTDDLALVTEEAADELVAAGLTAIIDLRSADEVAISGRGPFGARPVAYHHLALMANVGDSTQLPFTHESMGESYVGMVETAAPQLVTALNVVAHAPGATAFHCAAGRDRTGVLAAMLLLALGADDEDIVADYARTGENMPAIMRRTQGVMGPLLARLGVDEERLRGSLPDGPMDVSMRILLGTLRGRYGDPLTPLRDAGLSADTVARLRARALAA
ncbi:tyrosine-protein phosphatase [Agromyces soli]|uniref:Tyrosine-protein phosphatase n=1 Tax=Agromyces soli TaxID=659012 RepID=A0ABY4APQ5_9MICO|nr:tyrosine-protein phosphatase [Agromyces soli]UOE25142.1 tyrosine-protein phosphatase [Agromyces soli]